MADGYPATYYPLILDQNPVAQNDTFATTHNQYIFADVLKNDSDADGTLVPSSLTIVTAPLHGTARVNPADSTLLYQPDSGFTGIDTLQYTVADNLGAVSNVAAVIVNVEPPPVANNDTASTSTNQGVTIPILANDSATGTTLDATTIAIITPPQHGSLAITPICADTAAMGRSLVLPAPSRAPARLNNRGERDAPDVGYLGCSSSLNLILNLTHRGMGFCCSLP
jgi:hypothetical protein